MNIHELVKQLNDKYVNDKYEREEDKKKVFYNINELSGWRFYWKAIRNLDFKSIWYYWTR